MRVRVRVRLRPNPNPNPDRVQAADEFGPFPVQGRDSFKQGMVGIDLQPIPMPDNRAQYKQQPGYGAFHIKVRAS